MNEFANSITEYSTEKDALNIEYLKQKSVEFLHELCRNKWTDFNLHDPGITTLEILCLAINELAYRSNFDIEKIITIKKDEQINSYLNKDTILPVKIVTHDDLIKKLKHVINVANLFIEKNQYIKEFSGVYDIYIESYNSENKQKDLIDSIKNIVNQSRNLCTVFENIDYLKFEMVSCDLNVEVKQKVEQSKILYEVSEKLNKICISSKSLENNKHLYISDIIGSIMDIEEIAEIHDIKLYDKENNSYNWRYSTSENRLIKFDFKKSSLKLTYKNKLLFTSLLSETITKDSNIKVSLSNKKEVKLNIDNHYTSIQHDFPKNFGIGSFGFSNKDSKSKQASIKQFKGYIYLFDQFLCNAFKQLNEINNIYSFQKTDKTKHASLIKDFPNLFLIYNPFLKEYFLKNFETDNVKEMEKSWNIYYKENKKDILNSIQKLVENKKEFLVRRNTILNHILSRFGINTKIFETVSQLSKKELIEYKINILQNISKLTEEMFFGTDDIQKKIFLQFGAKNYLYSILGLRHNCNQYLTDFTSNKEKADFEISFPYKESLSIKELLTYSKNKYNFKKINLTSYKLKLSNNNFANIKILDKNVSLEKIISKINSIDLQSEGLYLVEHILLKPKNNYRVFNFEFEINSKPLFISKYFNRKNRNEIVDQFVSSINQEHLSIEEKDVNQFIIVWENKKNKIEGCNFYKTRNDAQKDIEKLIFKINLKNVDVKNYIKLKTKFYNIYDECEDPFSNIITVLIPNWSSRLQNDAFRSYVEETIIKEMPAHVVCYIKWLDIQEMIKFESTYRVYQKSLLSKNLNSKEKSLEKLIGNLIS